MATGVANGLLDDVLPLIEWGFWMVFGREWRRGDGGCWAVFGCGWHGVFGWCSAVNGIEEMGGAGRCIDGSV